MILLTSPREFLFLSARGRKNGNTEQLTRRAAHQLPHGTGQRWIDLNDLSLPWFTDERHTESAMHMPVGAERELLDATIACSDLVIASPVYWGSLAAPAKSYLDHIVSWVRLPDVHLRDRMRGKTLWGVGVLSGPGLDDAQPMVEMLASAADYLDMRLGGVLLGIGDRPGEVLHDAQSVARARTFFS
jgi:NAD(P)H-dependent FMN reductase